MAIHVKFKDSLHSQYQSCQSFLLTYSSGGGLKDVCCDFGENNEMNT